MFHEVADVRVVRVGPRAPGSHLMGFLELHGNRRRRESLDAKEDSKAESESGVHRLGAGEIADHPGSSHGDGD